MLCIVCKEKPAVIHYAEVVDGQIKKLDLCEQCAIKKGLGAQLSFSMGDLIGGITEEFDSKDTVVCPKCNMTIDEFRKCGRLGCSDCYSSFEDTLNSMVEQIHRSHTHKGKVPATLHSEVIRRKNLTSLEEDLKQSIANEDFEKAAFIRDEIRKLKKNS